MWRESGFAVSVDRITSALPAGIEAAAEKVPDAMLETFVAIGDRSRLRSHLRGYLAGGADVVLAYPLPVGEDAVASVRETQRAAAPGEARPGQESSAGPENARSEDRS
jgi:hypothetical protein